MKQKKVMKLRSFKNEKLSKQQMFAVKGGMKCRVPLITDITDYVLQMSRYKSDGYGSVTDGSGD